MASEFRISAWPGSPVPVPRVRRYAVEDVDGTHIAFKIAESQEVEIPREFVLREVRELDELDPAALLGFSEEWGALANFGEDPLAYLPTRRYPVSAPFGDYVEAAAETSRRYRQAGMIFIAISILQVHVQILKALARHWLSNSIPTATEPVEAAWKETPFSVNSSDQAWSLFFEHLDHGLQNLSVHVWSPDIDWKPPGANLYIASCVQLYNEIADHATYRICDNCGQPFSKQRGRSTTGQHRRKGVKYCQASCANAAAQRNYARRAQLREKKEGTVQ